MEFDDLPEIVHLDLVIEKFKMSNMERLLALKTILNFAKFDGLLIYFDNEVEGISSDAFMGEVLDENREFYDFVVPDENQILIMLGRKKIEEAHIYRDENEASYYFSISQFSQHGVNYDIPSESHVEYSDIPVEYRTLYCLRSELLVFKKAINQKNKNNNKATLENEVENYNKGEWKALALLAREKAENISTFKVGDKVNASWFKDHILSLAKIHDVSDLGLIKLDDKINKALTKFDIQKITPNVKNPS